MCIMRRRRLCGADDDARSRIWAVSSGSDTIGFSYGPIGIAVPQSERGRSSGNFGAGDYANAGVSGHPMWDSVQPGRLE